MRLFSKIRNIIPRNPSPREEEPPFCEPENPGGRKAREAQEVPVMREEVLGVRFVDFTGLPAEIWNQLTGSIREALKTLATQLQKAYLSGVESNLGLLVDKEIPQTVYAQGRETIENILNRERGFFGSTIRCDQCAKSLDYEGDRHLGITTRLGKVSVRRCYYRGKCGHTIFPLDELLGLGSHGMLPEIQETVALLASRVPYEEAVETIMHLLPIHLCVHTAERVTHRVAGEVQAEQAQELQDAFGNPAQPRFPEPESTDAIPVAVVGVDGGMCRVRNQEDKCKEFKLGVLGTLHPGQCTQEEPKVENKRYVAHIGSADTLFEHLAVEYHRMGLHRAKLLHVLADGSEWSWNRFPDLLQVGQKISKLLDFYHAAEHVQNAANALFGQETPDGAAWARIMRDRLKEDKLDDFFQEFEMQSQEAACRGRGETLTALLSEENYFRVRRDLLRYKECLEEGLPIGSGMVEGGIRFVGKDRLDRTGMRWSVHGAEQILQLRCLDASGRWKSFLKKQSTKRMTNYRRRKKAWLKAA